MKVKGALSWLNKSTKKYYSYIGFLTALEVIVSMIGICYALVMKQMVDRAVAKDGYGFTMGMAGFALLIAGQLLIRVITRQLSEFTRSSMENKLKKDLFSSLLKKDYGRISATHSEEWMNCLTSDTVICANGMTDLLPGFLGMLLRLVGSLVLIFWLQPGLAYIMIPCGVVFLFISAALRKPLKKFHKDVQEKDGQVRVYLQERISSQLIVRSFGVEDIAMEKADDVMELHKVSRMKKAWISNICNSGFSLAINGMYLLGIGYCGYGIINGSVSFGTLTAMIQLVGQLQSPLSGLGGYVPRVYAMIASAERLMEAEQIKTADVHNLRSEDEARALYKEQIKEIAFEHVSFHYPERINGRAENDALQKENVLPDMSFVIKKGDYVAITGNSGCGKSTMLKLLIGIYVPQAGSVEACLCNGTSIAIEELRRLFAYVPQGNFLMSGSIRDVITFGKIQGRNSRNAACGNRNNDCTDPDHQDKNCRNMEEKLRLALRLACADFVYELPQKLDTVLGEKGAGLSEGQMQRIAIARALYADRPVLILDEATSALDQQTEEKLLSNLKSLTDKTVLIVTHRAKALSICNKRLVFADGFVREKTGE